MIQDLIYAGPLLTVAGLGCLLLLLEAMWPGSMRVQRVVGVVGLTAAGVWGVLTVGQGGTAFGGMLMVGGVGGYWTAVFCLSGVLTLVLAGPYLRRRLMEHGEYHALLVFSLAGMIMMGTAADLVMFFLGLELMSVCFYVLAGFARGSQVSNEAALKYFLLGAFATGFLLYGIALVYGATGATSVVMIRSALSSSGILVRVGFGLILVGLAFKIAAVPFHMWVPDVYEGAPTTVTAFMSTAGKAAAFSALLLVFAPGVLLQIDALRDVMAAVAALSMIVGNVLAVSQTSVKRMLAYSSIAHAGYILTGVIAANATGAMGVLYYLLAYTLMNVGAFGVLALRESESGGTLAYEDYAGLGTRSPAVAFLMAIFMFSLTGIPPFAGFFGKYYVFAGAIAGGYTWLAILGVVMSLVSAYYYLRLVVVMYFREGPEETATPVARSGLAVLVLCAAALLGFGVVPSTVLTLARGLFP